MTKLKVEVFHSIHDIKPEIWNRIAAGRGFQSHAWYVFGERAMADSPATYLIAWDGKTPVGGAALFGYVFERVVTNAPPAFYFPWQILVITAGAVALIVTAAALVSLRRVLFLEPAVVFR